MNTETTERAVLRAAREITDALHHQWTDREMTMTRSFNDVKDGVREILWDIFRGYDARAARGEVVDAESHDAEVARLNAQIILLTNRLTGLSVPRIYDGDTEPIVCPCCDGAIDDHRANCKVEALQTISLWQQVEALKSSLYECPDCAFSFLRIHDDADGSGRFSCPCCAEAKLTAQIEALESERLLPSGDLEAALEHSRRLESENEAKESALVEWEKYRLFIPLAKGLIARIVEADANRDPPTDIGLCLESIVRERNELRERLRRAEDERDNAYVQASNDQCEAGEARAKLVNQLTALRSAVAPFVEVAQRVIGEFTVNVDIVTSGRAGMKADDWRALAIAYDTGEVKENDNA